MHVRQPIKGPHLIFVKKIAWTEHMSRKMIFFAGDKNRLKDYVSWNDGFFLIKLIWEHFSIDNLTLLRDCLHGYKECEIRRIDVVAWELRRKFSY